MICKSNWNRVYVGWNQVDHTYKLNKIIGWSHSNYISNIGKWYSIIMQWLLGSYNTQILLMVFVAIIGMLLAGFFGYHAKLCLSNTTTNEVLSKCDLEMIV